MSSTIRKFLQSNIARRNSLFCTPRVGPSCSHKGVSLSVTSWPSHQLRFASVSTTPSDGFDIKVNRTLNRTIDASKIEYSGTHPFDEDYDVFNSHMTPSCNRLDSEELVELDMLRLEDVIEQDGDDDENLQSDSVRAYYREDQQAFDFYETDRAVMLEETWEFEVLDEVDDY